MRWPPTAYFDLLRGSFHYEASRYQKEKRSFWHWCKSPVSGLGHRVRAVWLAPFSHSRRWGSHPPVCIEQLDLHIWLKLKINKISQAQRTTSAMCLMLNIWLFSSGGSDSTQHNLSQLTKVLRDSSKINSFVFVVFFSCANTCLDYLGTMTRQSSYCPPLKDLFWSVHWLITVGTSTPSVFRCNRASRELTTTTPK